ncbi:hypothetical protein CHH80_11940 [Bacillus sp. 7504-2]|nr:hypothetical protein CHH80_11940 [Bacillus sp. 7504-2]
MKKLFSKKKTAMTDKIQVYSPIDGKCVPLEQVKDPVFSDGSMGYGCAIIPSSQEIYSPISGKIASIFPTNHALGIIGDNGEELLLHVGVNTVELEGVGFISYVKRNEHVEMGKLLLKIDLDLIKQKGYDPDVIVILLNSNRYEKIEVVPKMTKRGEALFPLKLKT